MLEASADTIAIAPDIAIDAPAFETAAGRADLPGAHEAVALYRGALLADGLAIDSPEFDEWLDGERARLCRIAVGAMERIAAAAIAGTADRGAGIAAAERAIALDSYNEHAHRLLMELYAARGRPDLALTHFATLSKTLRRDLQVAPDPETQALHERIRALRASPRAPTTTPAATAPGEPAPPVALTALAAASGIDSPIRSPRRLAAFAPAALIGVMIALLIAAGLGIQRWISPPPAAPHVSRLFPIAADPAIEQRPALSPDGARVVYTARLADKANVDLYLATIGDLTPIRLTSDPEIDDNAVWAPDGSAIAFTRSSRDGRTPCQILLMPVPGGQERLIGHCRAAITSRLSWAPDGRMLYFSDAQSTGGVSRIYRLDTAGGQIAPITAPPTDIQGDNEPQVSRDGRLLAYLRTKAWQSVEVELLDLESGERRTLSHDGKTIWGLAWSGKDRGLLFSSDRGGDTGLWWIAADGSGLTRLTLGDAEYRALSFARNRDRLAYEALKDHASFFALPRNATPAIAPRTIANLSTNLFDRFYVESPAGRAAFVSVRAGPENLWVADRGKPPHQISFTQDIFYQEPAWSPDGRWIAYVAVSGTQSDISLISGDGGASRAITRDPALQQSPAWSPDGKWLYFTSRRSGAWRIWRIDPFARGAPVPVSGDGPRTVRPGPDGRWLYYAVDGQPGIRRRLLAPGGAALEGPEKIVVPDLHPSDWRNWWIADGAIFYARRGGGDPAGWIVRRDLATGAERMIADATSLLWSASFWVRGDGSIILTHRDLEIDVNGIDF